MRSLFRRRQPTRAELIERKRRLEGEINALRTELGRAQASGRDASVVERRLAAAQQAHYDTRLEIDRSPPDQ